MALSCTQMNSKGSGTFRTYVSALKNPDRPVMVMTISISTPTRSTATSILSAVWLVLSCPGIGYCQSPSEGGYIYWTNLESGIFRSELDGSNAERIVKADVRYPGDIVLDVSGGKMYWTDMVGGDIHCSNLHGANVKKCVDVGGYALDLALDLAGGKIYWTETFHAFDYSQGGLMRADLDGSDIELLTKRNCF